MMNVLALILVALPALTTSQALLSMNRWRDLYNRIQEGSRASMVRREYICCNQPPTPPSPGRRLRGMAPFMAKRGDKYTLLKRFFEDFGQDLPQRDQEAAAGGSDNTNALPSDLSALALAASESGSGSRASRHEDSLLRRLLDSARARLVLESLAQEDESDSALYDYPAKRGTFVRADGNKRHRKRHMHRHKKHRKH